MRVISGYLGGRLFEAPASGVTHAMSEKIRGAIFSALGDISGLTLLDAYSGSGALTIEAISRGAAYATAVESNKKAIRVITENIAVLGILDKTKVINAKVKAWAGSNDDMFDLCTADPPFDNTDVSELTLLVDHLKSQGILVLCWPGKDSLPKIPGAGLIKEKSYGDAQLGFYKKD